MIAQSFLGLPKHAPRFAVAAALALAVASVSLFHPAPSGGQCWTPGTMWCTVCGTTTPCSQQLCARGWLLYYCPSGSYEIVRISNGSVQSCQAATQGYYNCTTNGGSTLWCTVGHSCDTTTPCQRNPISGLYYCTALSTPGTMCGLTSAVFSGSGCPSPPKSN